MRPESLLKAAHPSACVFVYACHALNELHSTLWSPKVHLQVHDAMTEPSISGISQSVHFLFSSANVFPLKVKTRMIRGLR